MATAPDLGDDLQPAELGKPLRKRWGTMIPLCSCGGRQWLLAPMWAMNIMTLALILVPGVMWFGGVWHRRTAVEQWVIAPLLFGGTLLAYAFTTWVDPGIVQPGRFPQLEQALQEGATSANTMGGEALETPEELRTRWSHRGHQRGAQRVMVTADGRSMPVCAVCGVPQPPEHQVVHVTEIGACVEQYDHFCPWVNNAVGSGNTTAFYNFLLGVFLLLIYVMLTWTMAEVDDSGPDGGHPIPPRGGLRAPLLPQTGPAAPLVPAGVLD